jgi:hypothetical protein
VSATPISSVGLLESTAIRSPLRIGSWVWNVSIPVPFGFTAWLVPAAVNAPEPFGWRTRSVNGPPTAPCTFQRMIAPLTGEARFAPASGSVVLNWVRTPSNGVDLNSGGNTLPTVTVVAPAETAAINAQAVASAIANIPIRPARRPLRLLTSLRPVADMVLPSLYGSVFSRRLASATP